MARRWRAIIISRRRASRPCWTESVWRREESLAKAQTARIAERIDGMLTLVPQGIKQAHERIIGGRPVAEADRILSIYEPNGPAAS